MVKFTALDGAGQIDLAGPHNWRLQHDKDDAIHLFVRISNLEYLVVAYGEEVESLALRALDRIWPEVSSEIVKKLSVAPGCMAVSMVTPLTLHELRRYLAHIPVRLKSHVSHLVVTIDEIAAAPADIVCKPLFPEDAWAARYREDMAKVTQILEDIATDSVDLTWQAIKHSAEGTVLYQECLIRRDFYRPDEFVPAIERLGFARLLDDYIVTRVLDELEASDTAVLGANISAHSAVLDEWWTPVFERLRAKPSVAARFVIEITETAPLPSIPHAVAFVDALRTLGCRIALDDFGVGHMSIRQLLALRPDIVKIDCSFNRLADSSTSAAKRFLYIVGLASTVAPIVVAEGIETEDDRARAAGAGALWQQGYFWGGPSSIHLWRHATPGIRE
jgi:EAL domain-containing protein (putative c-di-GMP-specific phosphodiesterase class I)